VISASQNLEGETFSGQVNTQSERFGELTRVTRTTRRSDLGLVLEGTVGGTVVTGSDGGTTSDTSDGTREGTVEDDGSDRARGGGETDDLDLTGSTENGTSGSCKSSITND